MSGLKSRGCLGYVFGYVVEAFSADSERIACGVVRLLDHVLYK